MNLFNLLNKGAALAPKPGLTGAELRAIRKTRQQWQNALFVDQTRAWLSLGEQQAEIVRGLSVVLSVAAFAAVHDDGHEESLGVRVIRGGLSACEQCALAGATITAEHAKAFSAACERATAIITTCTDAAVVAAALRMRKLMAGTKL